MRTVETVAQIPFPPEVFGQQPHSGNDTVTLASPDLEFESMITQDKAPWTLQAAAIPVHQQARGFKLVVSWHWLLILTSHLLIVLQLICNTLFQRTAGLRDLFQIIPDAIAHIEPEAIYPEIHRLILLSHTVTSLRDN